MKLGNLDFSKIGLKEKIKLQGILYAITFIILLTIFNNFIDKPKLILDKEVQTLRESITSSAANLANLQSRLDALEAKRNNKNVSEQSSSEIASLLKKKDLAISLNNISGIIASRSGVISSLQTSLPEEKGGFKIINVRFELSMNYREFVMLLKDLNEKEKLTHIKLVRYELPVTPGKRGFASLELEIYGAS